MLNYFYWYAIIASVVPILYLMPFSELNTPLNPVLIVLLVLSIIISLALGKKFNDKFAYKDLKYKKSTTGYLPLVIIAIIAFIEFAIAKDIPLISVTLKHASEYKDFPTIPVLHVFSVMMALYFSTVYGYRAISYKQHRALNVAAYISINIIMLLYNMRSFTMISLFILANIFVAKRRRINKDEGRRANKIRISLLAIAGALLVFGFGCFGNMRHGYDWSNSYYIEKIGLYRQWPNFVPKQFMWAYSYLTSPLANLNYNFDNPRNDISIVGAVSQYLPESITKRMASNKSYTCSLKKHYFTVSTGYCDSYINMNVLGIVVFWFITMIFPLIVFRYAENENKREKYFAFISIYMSCITFMFFGNFFQYGGTAPALWLSFILLIVKTNKKTKEKRLADG